MYQQYLIIILDEVSEMNRCQRYIYVFSEIMIGFLRVCVIFEKFSLVVFCKGLLFDSCYWKMYFMKVRVVQMVDVEQFFIYRGL